MVTKQGYFSTNYLILENIFAPQKKVQLILVQFPSSQIYVLILHQWIISKLQSEYTNALSIKMTSEMAYVKENQVRQIQENLTQVPIIHWRVGLRGRKIVVI